MASETKPIKRSEQLALLSREHHDGLLFAWKIRQGLKNDTVIETIARFACWFWQSHLHHHFKQEEETLLPAMLEEDTLLQRMVNEHRQIEAIINHLQQPPFSKDMLSTLANLITDHIRFEERELFPYVEQSVSEAILNNIHAHLSTSDQCEKWEDEFWLKK